MKRKERDSLPRAAMKLLCTLLGMVLAVMLAATFAFNHLLQKVNYREPSLPSRDSALSVFSAIDLGSFSSGSAEEKIGGPGSGIINILLIGQDAREGETQARSDSMILCTFNRETKQITLTSFLRDLYVQIPGYHDNRINAAYSQGGTPLLNQTLEKNFGLHIDGNVEVDFTRFSSIVDLLGGVEIELRQDEADVINQETGSSLSAGIQRLDGFQALTYSRIRVLDADGDFSRTNRQRKVMLALVDAYKDVSITQLLPTMSQILPMITTDLNNGQILLCAMELLPHLSDAEIVSQRIPADGTYSDKNIDGMSVLVADMEQARSLLRQSLLGN